MKLASLYTVRDELRKKEGQYTSYGYYPYYEQGNQGRGSSSYGYRRPMYYNNDDDLMIKKDMDMIH